MSGTPSEQKPAHPAVEGPESPLEAIREQAHEEAGLVEKLALVESKLAEADAKLAAREKELMETLARLQADFDNFRRRSREDVAAAASRGKTELLKALLPVLDNLDRALQHSSDEGLALLARHLQGALASQGLVVLDPAGEAFDARMHEALAQESKEGVKSGTVVSVVERGYVLDGRVLRPARVVVAA